MLRTNRFRKWFSPLPTPVQPIRKKSKNRPFKFSLLPLEDRLAPAVFTYDSTNNWLTFLSDPGEVDNVVIASPTSSSLAISVRNDTITSPISLPSGFSLSLGDTLLEINTNTAPISLFIINLGTTSNDTNDVLTFGGLSLDGDLTATAGTINLAGPVSTSGNVTFTTVNSLTSKTDNGTADIKGAIVNLNVTGAGNQIGDSDTNFLEVQAKTRLDASTNNGLIAISAVNNDLLLGTLNAGNSSIFLNTENGAIKDANSGLLNLKAANGAHLTTHGNGSSIGTAANPIETAIGLLSAETYDGDIYVSDSNANGIIIKDALAKQQGSVPSIDKKYQVVVLVPDIIPTILVPVAGKKNVSITARGDILLFNVTAPNVATITSSTGRIIDSNQADNNVFATSTKLVSNGTAAGSAVGLDGDSLEIITENFTASTKNGSINLMELMPGTATSVIAGSLNGSITNALVESSAPTLSIGTITAETGTVTINETGGALLSTSGMLVKGLNANLSGNSGIGTSKSPFTITTSNLIAAVENREAPIFINCTTNLDSLDATTNAGEVAITYPNGALHFTTSTNLLTVSGVEATFSNTGGDIVLGPMSVNAITASGSITADSTVKLTGTAVTLEAGTGIGTDGAPIKMHVTSLDARTSKGSIYIVQDGSFTLNATSSGFLDPTNNTDGDIRIIASGDITVGSVLAPGDLKLVSNKAILTGQGTPYNLSANTLSITASNGIGSRNETLQTSIRSLTANSGSGGLFMVNSKPLTLTSVKSGDDISIFTAGSMTIGLVTASNHDVSLTALGALIDGNSTSINITADNTTLKGSSIGSPTLAIGTVTDSITASTTTGGIYLSNTSSVLILDATALGRGANIDIQTTDALFLNTATAQGDTVKLRAGTRISDHNDTYPITTINITAKILDFAAPDGIGTETNPLEVDVDQVATADGGNGGVFTVNAGPLLLTESALEASGTGTLTFDAASITIEQIADGTAHIAPGRTVILRTQTGSIVFLDPTNTIETSDGGAIGIYAGEVVGSGGVAVLGNLKTDGGNIVVNADLTITIGLLNAGAGKVTVQSANGQIIDGNGAAINMIAGSATLIGAGRTARENELDEVFKIAEAASLAALAAAEQTAVDALSSAEAILQTEVDNSTITVAANKEVMDKLILQYQALQYTVYTLSIGATALTIVAAATQVAATAAELVAGPAQAVPATGDFGADTVAVLLNVPATFTMYALTSLNVQITALSIAATEIGAQATAASFTYQSSKDRLELATTALQAFAESGSITLAAATESAINRDAAALIRDQAIAARDQMNVIGTPIAPLGLQVDGIVNVDAGPTNSYLEIVGPTALDLIESTGHVTLISTGAITDGDSDGSADILGNGLTIAAAGGIGTVDNPIETRVDTLNATNTVTGDIVISNTVGEPGALEITGASNSGGGDIIVSNQGNTAAGQGITVSGPISADGTGAGVTIHSGSPLTIDADITAADAIVLEAADTAGPGDNLTVNPGVTIQSTDSRVTLRAGDNILVAVGATIQANSTITMTGNDNAVDTSGVNVVVEGTLIAASAIIGVDPTVTSDDTFTITPSKTTPITVDGSKGIDILNFNADGLPVTIVGNTITALGRAPVTFINIESVNITNAFSDGKITLFADPGMVDNLVLTGTDQGAGTYTLNGGIPISFSGVTQFNYNSGDRNDTTIVSPFATPVLPWNVAVTIDGGTGTDRIIYNNVAGLLDNTAVTATAPQAGHIDSPGVTSALNSQLVSFTHVEKVSVNANTNEDENLTVNLRDTSALDTANLLFSDSADDLQLAGLFDINIDTANFVGLTLNGRGGNDTFNVTPGPIPVFIDGGDPIGSTAGDTINFTPTGHYTLEPGPHNDQGGLRSDLAQPVSWNHIEALSVTGGIGTFLGTNANDVINVVARDGSYDARADGTQDFTISLNIGPNILFVNTPVFRVDALAGHDDIELQAPASNGAAWSMQDMTLFGNDGNDTIHANTTDGSNSTITLDGGAGDDCLEGGAGNDILIGGNDNDTFIASPGNDTINGGAGQNTFLIRGTISNDVIDVFQNAPTNSADSGFDLDWSLNGVVSQSTITQNKTGSPLAYGTKPTVQSVRIDSGLGDDLIRVGVSDSYSDLADTKGSTNGLPNQSLKFDVHSNAASNSRLIVRDDGLGDLITHYVVSSTSGRVSVAPSVTVPNGGTGLGNVVYDGISRVDIASLNSITGGTGTDGNGRIVVFQPDPFEANDTRLNSTQLNRLGQSSVSPSITPGGFTTPFDTNGDEDWYEFTPSSTNSFEIKILFDKVLTLPNGRPGLPGGGDLSLDIYDANGRLITSGVADANGNNRTATFAATNDTAFPQFNRIFVRVKGAGDQPSLSFNCYDFANLSGLGNGTPGSTSADKNGPQVTGVNITNNPLTTTDESTYNIFDPKAATGPTPLVPSMEVHFVDSPARAPGFLYTAINEHLFEGSVGNRPAMGLFSMVGDRVGNVPIKDVVLTNNPVVAGEPATATITIIFDTSSHTFAGGLPDDRYTLSILDSLTDPTGAKLDGESTGAQPTAIQPFPSGDGHAGGNYVSRFTVDSRPEIGTFGNGSNKTFIDLNGNGTWDPQGSGDAVNHDNGFIFGQATDTLFAGNFAAANATSANGYDKLGAYGKVGGQYRLLLDLNGDGFADFTIIPTLQINGTPVAGDFAPNHPGQEIGVYSNGNWYLDSNGDNNLDNTDLVINNALKGMPLVGDFDGDGTFDLAVYNSSTNAFTFDLGNNGYGQADTTINFGFPTVNELAVASDMNQDGVSDIGLFVPRSTNSSESLACDWYFLVSLGTPTAGSVSTLNHAFNQTPFSNDMFFTYGDSFYKPIVGNFDPPIANAPMKSANPQVLVGVPQFAAGSGVGEPSAVSLFNADGSISSSFNPFPGTTGGVRTAVADFNGDGNSDIAVGTGPAVVAQVKIFDGVTHEVLFEIQPFDDFSGGVFVAAGDVNGDGIAELIITPDETGGPRVEVFTGGEFQQMANFFGIDDTNFRGGARAAVGDINGDGFADLVVSAGFGGGPRVSVYDGKALSRGEQIHPVPDFFMFESTLRNGVYVTVGDVNGDGFADIVGGAGPGGGPRVMVISGQTLLTNGLSAAINNPVANFFAGDPDQRNGVRVAVKNLDNDNRADLIVGDGQGSGSKLTAYTGTNLVSGLNQDLFSFDAVFGSLNGIFVG